MSVTPLKERFGRKLKEHIHNAHLRQADIAAFLGVTSSAVSQMISGKIIPNQAQIEKIWEHLAISREQFTEMTSMLSQIRTGATNLRSPFNLAVFSMRCRQGMSLKELSKAAEIRLDRITRLESDPEVKPKKDEIESLAKVFDVPASKLTFSEAENDPYNVSYETAVTTVSEVREVAVPYNARTQEMLLDANIFKLYRKGLDIFKFASEHSTESYSGAPEFDQPTIAIRASGRELDILWSGMITMHIVETRPSNALVTEFCRMKNGSFRLRELKGRTWRDFATRSRRKANNEVEWALPVLEFTFHA